MMTHAPHPLIAEWHSLLARTEAYLTDPGTHPATERLIVANHVRTLDLDAVRHAMSATALELYAVGYPWRQIGELVGITGQRVQTIAAANYAHPDAGEGVREASAARTRARQAARAARTAAERARADAIGQDLLAHVTTQTDPRPLGQYASEEHGISKQAAGLALLRAREARDAAATIDTDPRAAAAAAQFATAAAHGQTVTAIHRSLPAEERELYSRFRIRALIDAHTAAQHDRG